MISLHHLKGSCVMIVPMAMKAMVRHARMSMIALPILVATEATAQMWEPTPTTVLAITVTCSPTAHVKRFEHVLLEKTTVMRMRPAITKDQVSTAAHVVPATLAVGRSVQTQMDAVEILASME